MILLYIWAGLAGLLCILFVLKLVIQIVAWQEVAVAPTGPPIMHCCLAC